MNHFLSKFFSFATSTLLLTLIVANIPYFAHGYEKYQAATVSYQTSPRVAVDSLSSLAKSSLQTIGIAPNSTRVESTVVKGIPILKASIDLNDPETIFTIVPAETVESMGGFTRFAKATNAALIFNTTFKDPKKETWTKVSQGSILEGAKSKRWSTGYVFSLERNNHPQMMNRVDSPKWENYWFAVTSLPRLLEDGKVKITGSSAYLDSRGIQRSAIGFSKSSNMFYSVITDEQKGAIYIPKLAQIMQSIGCDEALNMEGGDGVLLAQGQTIYVNDVELRNEPVRAPVIVVYDSSHKAPKPIRNKWKEFNSLDPTSDKHQSALN